MLICNLFYLTSTGENKPHSDNREIWQIASNRKTLQTVKSEIPFFRHIFQYMLKGNLTVLVAKKEG